MTKKSSPKKRVARAKPAATKAAALAVPRAKRAIVDGSETRFGEVIALIEAARRRAYQAVNTELVGHYWELGEYISRKIASAEWGDGVVEDLAADLARRYPGVRGYTRPNLFRMRQFYEAYRSNRKVSPLVRQLPWTHHLIILSQAKPVETREFYIIAAIKERWPKRELERQIRSGAVLRKASATKKVSPAVRQTHPTAIDEFKNAYNVEFLGLAADHSEADLHDALLRNVGRFLTELGRDFCFVGSKYPVQVGKQDFEIDLWPPNLARPSPGHHATSRTYSPSRLKITLKLSRFSLKNGWYRTNNAEPPGARRVGAHSLLDRRGHAAIG
jgi:predicted nuclease of restriction endonuclease-like (RecB) superfamily